MSTNAVDAKLIMELRQRTLYPVLECKRALIKFDGDINAAETFLKSQGAVLFNLPALMRHLEKRRNEENTPPSADK